MSDFDTIRARLFEREVYGYNERQRMSLDLAKVHGGDGAMLDR